MIKLNKYLFRIFSVSILLTLSYSCTSAVEPVEELTKSDFLQGTWVVQQAIINEDEVPVTSPGLGQIEATFEGDRYKYVFPEIGTNGFPTGNTDFIEGTWSFNDSEDTILIDRSASQEEALEWKIINLSNGILDTEYLEYFPGSSDPSVFRFSYRVK